MGLQELGSPRVIVIFLIIAFIKHTCRGLNLEDPLCQWGVNFIDPCAHGGLDSQTPCALTRCEHG